MNNTHVLIACECSGVVRDAFRERGFDAWSCDFKPSDPGRWSRFHLQGDVRRVLAGNFPEDMVDSRFMLPSFGAFPVFRRWDLIIAHPDCTYLSSSGLHWNARGAMVDGRPRAELTEEALAFVSHLWTTPVPYIAIENPVGCINTRLPFMPKPQYIQPYQFGHDASKKTGLWTRNLPPLRPTKVIPGRVVDGGRRRWANQTDSGQNRLGPSPTRAADRARTYPGIAAAMAEQWGNFILHRGQF